MSPANELHQAMMGAFRQVFGDRMAEHPIELTRAVEQSGRFLSSIYEIDYREMTRGTWRRARATSIRPMRSSRPTSSPHGQAGG
jgi:chromosome partitioning protein